MLLCLDVGNTHILGGVFQDDQLVMRFRYATNLMGTADQFGVFLLDVLRHHQINPQNILAVSVCLVVPHCDYTIKHSLSLYLPHATAFFLQAGVKTGLNIKYKNPNEVGADRIATAIGAMTAFPARNIIVIDMGTATTLCAINQKKDYLGGAILPGMRLGMEVLKANAAKLMAVEIDTPSGFVGRTTRDSIQAGLYYGQLGALKELVAGFTQEVFQGEKPLVIGTGGFSQLFKDAILFDLILPDLVLQGLRTAYFLNV